ncbi:MAG TPA: hypothetical protein VFG65_08295 [Fimbriimonadales bacterium]|jgi:hypothetical protein|nr:hypothetical protein [Fimbriimonadales bacterium]
MTKKSNLILASIAAVGIMGTAGAALFGDIITDLLKIGGVGLVVDRFGPDINKAFNTVQGFKSDEAQMTKVVPILSVGQGKYVGAVQVMGPKSAVQKVKAVAQVETKFAGTVRLKAMIPVESKNVVENIRRVPGVGISGIVDLKL